MQWTMQLQLYRMCSRARLLARWLAGLKTKMKHALNAKSFIHNTKHTDAERNRRKHLRNNNKQKGEQKIA